MLDLVEGTGVLAANMTPMLLGNAGYYGTLAAVRALGRSGVPVTTADPSLLAPGRYSRFTRSHLKCPPFEQTDAWARWLMGLDRKGPRPALYATSDAVSFALARYRDVLSEAFRLYQPPLETMIQILDKGRLLDHARAVGIDTPDTWLPTSRQDAERIARDIDGTVLVKPRSQLAIKHHIKGAVAGQGAAAILATYDQFVRQAAHNTRFATDYPDAMLPMLQRYHPAAMETIYSLTGFRDISGQHVAMLGARKVLQRPRRLGVGLCFEDAPIDPNLTERVLRLCERIGYYGAFEIEFILCGDKALLIDFNGRFYNQMVFDTARGLDLPGLVYAATTGNVDRVAQLASVQLAGGARESMVFCNGFGFEVTMRAQRVFGSMTREEVQSWREWLRTPGRRIVDAVRDSSDPLPSTIDIAQQVYQCLRHPRAFLAQSGMAN